MLQTIVNAWRIADLRKKILFTAFILLIFRIGSAITIPFVDFAAINDLGIIADVDTGSSFLSYLNMMTGNAFNYATILAMSITPYINSSIIMQLLTVAIPALERLQKEGEEGRKKIASITRYVTIGLALMQSTAYYFYLRNGGGQQNVVTFLQTNAKGELFTGFPAVLQALVIILVLTAGAGLTMWLGERINEKGIGNGVSLILFAGIIARIPSIATQLWSWKDGGNGVPIGYGFRGGIFTVLAIVATLGLLGIVAFIVWMDNAERRIPVQYAKRVVGRKMYGGQSTHIPIKVNMSGVMPVIFASSILSLPPTVEMFLDSSKVSAGWQNFFRVFQQNHWAYAIIYFVMIIGFAYFYSSIQYDPVEMSNNIRKNSGTIPGYRPGQPTADYIRRILNRLTLLGALLLSVVALFPIVYSLISGPLMHLFGVEKIEDSYGHEVFQTLQIAMGGTSVIIMVGVALETVKQLESQMMMRHYKGFLD
ncbi:MAG: preprotein translocase subunit SecY [Oscillospiraceae bacterium]|jgi:preprotein translocase subunit SecY|nr:preprotein translocase subunit SecY [Oscillospiraceae bacterium]